VVSRILTVRLQIVTDTSNGCASGFLNSGVEGSGLRCWQVMFETLRLCFLLFTGLAELRQVQHELASRNNNLAFSEIRGQIFILSWEITLIPMIC